MKKLLNLFCIVYMQNANTVLLSMRAYRYRSCKTNQKTFLDCAFVYTGADANQSVIFLTI